MVRRRTVYSDTDMNFNSNNKEKPIPVLASTSSADFSQHLNMFMDDAGSTESKHDNAVLYPPLPEPVPAVVGDFKKKPIPVIYLDDSDTTMMSLGSSVKSPRAELSMAGEEMKDDIDEHLEDDQESDEDSF